MTLINVIQGAQRAQGQRQRRQHQQQDEEPGQQSEDEQTGTEETDRYCELQTRDEQILQQQHIKLLSRLIQDRINKS